MGEQWERLDLAKEEQSRPNHVIKGFYWLGLRTKKEVFPRQNKTKSMGMAIKRTQSPIEKYIFVFLWLKGCARVFQGSVSTKPSPV
jgi:hypothetical protein